MWCEILSRGRGKYALMAERQTKSLSEGQSLWLWDVSDVDRKDRSVRSIASSITPEGLKRLLWHFRSFRKTVRFVSAVFPFSAKSTECLSLSPSHSLSLCV